MTKATAKAKATKRCSKKKETQPEAKKQDCVRVKEINKEFLARVCAASGTTEIRIQEIAKLLEGIRKVLLADVQEKGHARLPNVVAIRQRTIKARPAGQKPMFGVMRPIKARGECKKVLMRPLASFKHSLAAI